MGTGEDLVDSLFLGLKGKYFVLFPRIANPVMCAQKIHSQVALEITVFL